MQYHTTLFYEVNMYPYFLWHITVHECQVVKKVSLCLTVFSHKPTAALIVAI